MKAFTCCLVQNGQPNEDITGTAISEHLLPVADPSSSSGLRYEASIGVLWDDHRTPSPSYHKPEELYHLGIPELDSIEFEDEEDEEDEDNIEVHSDNYIQD